MEAIKLWQIDGDDVVTPLSPSGQMESEDLLEDVLVKHPGLLGEGLTLVGRQTPTEGGPLDLLGVDRDGRLCVFELKRGTLSRGAVAQIIDYASYLDDMDMGALAVHITECSGTLGIEDFEDFEDWYNVRHGELEKLKPMRLFLVGLGVDDRTERMVRFLAVNSGMDISLLTFHGFNHDGKTLLAKQVEVEAVLGTGDQRSRRSLSVAEKRKLLDERIAEREVSDLITAIRDTFRDNWPEYNETTGETSIGIRMPAYVDSKLRQRTYVAVYPGHRSATMVFYRQAADLSPGTLRPLVEKIGSGTQHDGHDPLTYTKNEVRVRLSSDNWNEYKQAFSKVLQNIHRAYLEASFVESASLEPVREALSMFRINWPDFNEKLHRLGG